MPQMRSFVALRAALAGLALALGPAAVAAQQPNVRAPIAPANVPAPRPGDVETIEAIVTALYASISGPAGEARDWNRFRSLFIPGARLIPVNRVANDQVSARVMTPEEYALGSGTFLQQIGFVERELTHRIERFNDIAQLFSSYDGRGMNSGQETVTRGINSIQLMWDGTRWWVVTILWSAERPGAELPAEWQGMPR